MGFWSWLTKGPSIPPPPRKSTREIIQSFRDDIDPVCLHCRYNLRGLATGAKCPECGGETLESWLVYLANRTGYAARSFWIFKCAMRWYHGSAGNPSPPRHMNARDFCYLVRAYALSRTNDDRAAARSALKFWGVWRSEDIGAVVYAMIDVKMMQASERDSPDDFDGLFDVDSLFAE